MTTWNVVKTWLSGDWLLVAAILVGCGLRLYQLSEQIIADDEWHALHSARDLGFASIAMHFGGADVSIPMALFYKAVMGTFGLSEVVMRAPVVLFGLLTLVSFPLLVRRLFDRTTATLFGWLLTISPLHIYYSRYARPYSIALFCAFCGICSFHLWRTTRLRRWKQLYGVCAIVGPYFHLSVLPVLCAPLALISVFPLWRRSRDPEFSSAELGRLFLFIGGGLAILLLPPIYGDFGSLAEKAQRGSSTSEAVTAAFGLLLGMEARSAQVVTFAIIALGALSLLAAQPRLRLLLATSTAVAILAILIARPAGIEFPIVLARYSLFLLPILLLSLAAGLRTVGGWLSGTLRPAAVAIWVAWIVLSVKAGPLGRIYYSPNNFTNHGAFQYYPYVDAQRNPYVRDLSRPVSAFYVELGRQPAASLRILEAPWYYEWHYNPYPFYQRIHRQRVAIGFVKSEPSPAGELPAFDQRFRFRNFVHLRDVNGLCAHKIDRVVLHKDLPTELGRPVDRDFSKDLPALTVQYQHALGAPIFEDPLLVVFSTTAHCLAAANDPKTVISYAMKRK